MCLCLWCLPRPGARFPSAWVEGSRGQWGAPHLHLSTPGYISRSVHWSWGAGRFQCSRGGEGGTAPEATARRLWAKGGRRNSSEALRCHRGKPADPWTVHLGRARAALWQDRTAISERCGGGAWHGATPTEAAAVSFARQTGRSSPRQGRYSLGRSSPQRPTQAHPDSSLFPLETGNGRKYRFGDRTPQHCQHRSRLPQRGAIASNPAMEPWHFSGPRST